MLQHANSKQLALYFPMLLSTCYWALIKIAMTLFPYLPHVFGVSDHAVHNLLTLALVVSSLISVVWGYYCHQIHVKRLLVAIIVVALLSLGFMLTSNKFIIFAVGFVLAAVFLNALAVASRYIALSYFSSRSRIEHAMKLRLVGAMLASIIAPIVGGWLIVVFDWRMALILLVIWLVVVMLCLLTMPNMALNKRLHSVTDYLCNLKDCFSSRRFTIYASAFVIVAIISDGYVIALPFWLTQRYPITADHIAYFFTPLILIATLGLYASHSIGGRITHKMTISFSLVCLFLSGFGCFILNSVMSNLAWVWILPGVGVSLAYVGLAPLLSAGAVHGESPARKSAASAIFSMLSKLSSGLGAFVALRIGLDHFDVEGILIVIMSCLLLVLLSYTSRRR